MSQYPVTRCGAWLSSTAPSAGTTSGEGADPHPAPPFGPAPLQPCAGPTPASLTLTLRRSWPCPTAGAGHRWSPHPLATGVAFLCIQHGSSHHAGTGTRITAALTPTPAQLLTATTGEVRAWCVLPGLPQLWAVYLALTPRTSTSGALSTKVSVPMATSHDTGPFFHVLCTHHPTVSVASNTTSHGSATFHDLAHEAP